MILLLARRKLHTADESVRSSSSFRFTFDLSFRGPYLENDPHAYEKYFLDAKAMLDEQVRNGRKVTPHVYPDRWGDITDLFNRCDVTALLSICGITDLL